MSKNAIKIIKEEIEKSSDKNELIKIQILDELYQSWLIEFDSNPRCNDQKCQEAAIDFYTWLYWNYKTEALKQ